MDEQETTPEVETDKPEVTETPDETEESEVTEPSAPVDYHMSTGAPVRDTFLVQ